MPTTFALRSGIGRHPSPKNKTPHSDDEGGDFSGSGTIMDDKDQTPVLTVSSNTNSVVFLLVPEDRTDPYLTNWVYVEDNPVYYTDCRDPKSGTHSFEVF